MSDNLERLDKKNFDLAIATGWALAEPKDYAAQGGHVLIASAARPDFEVAPVVKTESDLKGYVRVRDRSAFPSLKESDLLLLNGAFTGLKVQGPSALTLIRLRWSGRRSLSISMKATDIPAIVSRAFGRVSVTWIPWNLGALYYRLSLPAHAGLFRDLMARLLPGKQIRTNAHPLLEMTLMRQGVSRIEISVAGTYRTGKTKRNAGTLTLTHSRGYTGFTMPRVHDYELVVLE